MIFLYDDKYKEELLNLGFKYDNQFNNKYFNCFDKIYLYKKEDKIVGFLIAQNSIDEINIILLYVDEQYRRQKIASMLIDYLISSFSNNIDRIILEVSKNNRAAISLYDKFGFIQIGHRKNYYSDGSDAIVMERKNNYE